jgi:hypothetical protein
LFTNIPHQTVHLPAGIPGWYTASKTQLEMLYNEGIKETMRKVS